MGFYYQVFVLLLRKQTYTWLTALSETPCTKPTGPFNTMSHHFSNPNSAISLKSLFTLMLPSSLPCSYSGPVIPIPYPSICVSEIVPTLCLSVLPCPSLIISSSPPPSIVPLTS
ncbi:hypothetical protein M758_2G078100, partial [Ceratodon purpureus]